MKRGSWVWSDVFASNQAYTIVEVMIFLAVSSVLFFVVARSIAGQTTRAQFTESVRNFESRLQDLANDVSTGFYPGENNFTCKTNISGNITITPVSSPRGTNGDCIFVGQVINFDRDDVPSDSFMTITLAGRRYKPGGGTTEVESLSDTAPTPIQTSTPIEKIGPVDLVSVSYNNGLARVNVESFAFTTTFKKYSGAKLDAGDVSVDMVPLLLNCTPGCPTNNASHINTALTDPAAVINPTNGIDICLKGGINQYATVTLGGNGRHLSTKVAFATGACP